MTKIRRYWQSEQICFLTHVTVNREPLLIPHFDLLWQAIESHRTRTPLYIIAWMILPDHLHVLIDVRQQDVSSLMRRIKLSFSASVRGRLDMDNGRIWQYRFWDRIMRDQEDINCHIDYIHYNPVKHGYVSDPFAWEQSSLRQYWERGVYQRDWGVREPVEFAGEYGE